jgi:hypothetical protein
VRTAADRRSTCRLGWMTPTTSGGTLLLSFTLNSLVTERAKAFASTRSPIVSPSATASA